MIELITEFIYVLLKVMWHQSNINIYYHISPVNIKYDKTPLLIYTIIAAYIGSC